MILGLRKEHSLELSVLISLCGFVASFVFSVVSTRNALMRTKQENERDLERRGREQAEQSFLLNQINTAITRLSSSIEIIETKLQNLSERLLLAEEKQKVLSEFSSEIKQLSKKTDRNSVLIEQLIATTRNDEGSEKTK